MIVVEMVIAICLLAWAAAVCGAFGFVLIAAWGSLEVLCRLLRRSP
jgi:hypothetical protein